MKYRNETNLRLVFSIKRFIYILYILYILVILTFHQLPIKLKKHAALRLIQRFDISIDELKHILKTGKQIKVPGSKGEVGIIERKIGKGYIRIKFKIENENIWIITVEGGKTK